MGKKLSFAILVISIFAVGKDVAIGDVSEEIIDKKGSFLLNPKTTFEHYCAPCHGETGEGDGRYYSSDLNPQPRALTDVEYMSTRTDEQLLLSISEGAAAVGKSNLCPPWGKTLSEEQINGIIAYLRSLTSTGAEEPVKEAASQSKQGQAAEKTSALVWIVLILLCALLVAAAVYQWRRIPSNLEGQSREAG